MTPVHEEIVMKTLTVELPDGLVEEAQDAGLPISSDAIEAMIRENLRDKAVDRLFRTANRLAAAGFPPMTTEEIQAEVNAVRAKRR